MPVLACSLISNSTESQLFIRLSNRRDRPKGLRRTTRKRSTCFRVEYTLSWLALNKPLIPERVSLLWCQQDLGSNTATAPTLSKHRNAPNPKRLAPGTGRRHAWDLGTFQAWHQRPLSQKSKDGRLLSRLRQATARSTQDTGWRPFGIPLLKSRQVVRECGAEKAG